LSTLPRSLGPNHLPKQSGAQSNLKQAQVEHHKKKTQIIFSLPLHSQKLILINSKTKLSNLKPKINNAI
jgi:hypothetical protein